LIATEKWEQLKELSVFNTMNTLENLKNALLVALVVMLVYVLYKRMIKVLHKGKVTSQYPNIGNSLIVENNQGRITVELQKKTYLIVEIFDHTNNPIFKVAEGDFENGEQVFTFELTDLPKGKHYYKVTSPNQESSQYFQVD
jgi:hypothetical protein